MSVKNDVRMQTGRQRDISSQLTSNSKFSDVVEQPCRKRQRTDKSSEDIQSSGSVAKKVWETYLEELDDPMKVDKVLTKLLNMNRSRKLTCVFEKILDRNVLNEETLLKCRLVCRSWNNCVQNYIQRHPSHLDMTATYHLPEAFRMNFLYSKDNPDHILGKMISAHQPNTNPFLSRSISFTIENYMSTYLPDSQNWSQKVTNLLERYGMQVWYCCVLFGEECIDAQTAYRILRDWIKFMPNLKALRVFYEDHMDVGTVNDLENEIAEHPMSKLKDLVFLTTGNLPYPIFNEICSQIPKGSLRKLRINPNNEGICKSNANGIDKYNWLQLGENVMEASVTVESRVDFLNLESSIEQWPLKRLYLDLDIPDKGGSFDGDDEATKWVNWNRIFSFLEQKFGSNLTDLELDLPREGRKDFALKKVILEHSLQHRLNLVHVKKLHVKVYNVTSVDFLLPMKDSLEDLYVEFCLVDWSEVDSASLKRVRSKETIKLHSSRIFIQPDSAGPKGVKVNMDDEFTVTHFMRSQFPKLKNGVIKFSNCVIVRN